MPAKVKAYTRKTAKGAKLVKQHTRKSKKAHTVPEGTAVKVSNSIQKALNTKVRSMGNAGGSDPWSNVQDRYTHHHSGAKTAHTRQAKAAAALLAGGYAEDLKPYKGNGSLARHTESLRHFKKGHNTVRLRVEKLTDNGWGKPSQTHVLRVSVTGLKKAKRSTLPYYD